MKVFQRQERPVPTYLVIDQLIAMTWIIFIKLDSKPMKVMIICPKVALKLELTSILIINKQRQRRDKLPRSKLRDKISNWENRSRKS